MTTPTIAYYEDIYLSTAKANSNTTDISEFTDIQIQAKSIAGVCAGVAQDASILFNSIYPQNSDAFGVNTQLSARGSSPQYPATPAQITCNVVGVPIDKIYYIPLSTVLYANDNSTYQIVANNPLLDYVIVTANNPALTLLSIKKGSNTLQEIGNILKFSPAIVPIDNSNNPLYTAIVTQSIDGANEESITNAVNRLINLYQVPLASSRTTDLKNIIINPAIGTNDAIVLCNNQLQYSSDLFTVGAYVVGGSPVNDELLNKGLQTGTTAQVFNRSLNSTIQQITQQKLVAQNICNLFPNTNTIATQGITTITNPATPYIKVSVGLQFGYTLSSRIQLSSGVFTLYQLIQREIRRAICSQPFGASLSVDLNDGSIQSSSIPISALEQALDEAFGTPTTIGTIGQYLTNRTVLLYDGTTWSYNPEIALNLGIPVADNDTLKWNYDISLDPAHIYSNILVTN